MKAGVNGNSRVHFDVDRLMSLWSSQWKGRRSGGINDIESKTYICKSWNNVRDSTDYLCMHTSSNLSIFDYRIAPNLRMVFLEAEEHACRLHVANRQRQHQCRSNPLCQWLRVKKIWLTNFASNRHTSLSRGLNACRRCATFAPASIRWFWFQRVLSLGISTCPRVFSYCVRV